jgi:hypothetical protein
MMASPHSDVARLKVGLRPPLAPRRGTICRWVRVRYECSTSRVELLRLMVSMVSQSKEARSSHSQVDEISADVRNLRHVAAESVGSDCNTQDVIAA